MSHLTFATPVHEAQMNSGNVLAEIYRALQRLENSIEDQQFRIQGIEGSIRSSTSSPIHERFSSLANSLTKEKDLPDLPRLASPSSAYMRNGTQDYEATVMKLHKRRFEFVDDSCSDLESTKEIIEFERQEDYSPSGFNAPGVHQESLHTLDPWNRKGKQPEIMDYSDVYSQSVYSSRPLSRLELQIPAIPSMTMEEHTTPTRYTLHDSPIIHPEDQKVRRSLSARSHVKTLASSLSSIRYRKLWGITHSKSTSSVTSVDSNTSPTHERVELTFFAYDNLKTSVQASLSFRSKERSTSRSEARRLNSLSSTSANGVATNIMPSERSELAGKGGLESLYSLAIRGFEKVASNFRRGTVSFVA